jgi:hypothetical protein
MNEMQTVEIRFPGERLARYTDHVGITWTLYRMDYPSEGLYRIHADDGSRAWVEGGRNGNGLEEWEVRWLCPGFFQEA